MKGHEQAIWFGRLEEELGNLRAALSWCVKHGEGQRIARVAWASWTYWMLSGRMSEDRRWMEAALESEPGMPDTPRARLLATAAALGYVQGDFGFARSANEESMELFRRLGDEAGMCLTASNVGLVAVGQGRPEEGLSMMEETAERALELADNWLASTLSDLSSSGALGLGDGARARRLAERSLSLGQEIGAREATSSALPTLATIARSEDDLTLAGSLFGEGLRLSYELGERTNIAYYMEGLAEINASEGKLERAAKLWGAAGGLLETIEDVVTLPHVAADRSFFERRLAEAREGLKERRWEEPWSEGRAMTTEETVRYALAKRRRRTELALDGSSRLQAYQGRSPSAPSREQVRQISGEILGGVPIVSWPAHTIRMRAIDEVPRHICGPNAPGTAVQ